MCQTMNDASTAFVNNPFAVGGVDFEIENIKREVRRLTGELNILRSTVIGTPKEPAVTNLNFGEALVWTKKNQKITRKAWHNPSIYVWLWGGAAIEQPDGILPELRVKTISGKSAPWMPNHTELLADDWEVV